MILLYDGSISEILIFKQKLTRIEMVLVHNYLAEKWDLTNTVDSDGDYIVDSLIHLQQDQFQSQEHFLFKIVFEDRSRKPGNYCGEYHGFQFCWY